MIIIIPFFVYTEKMSFQNLKNSDFLAVSLFLNSLEVMHHVITAINWQLTVGQSLGHQLKRKQSPEINLSVGENGAIEVVGNLSPVRPIFP
jgi:hypothetical protein